MKAPFNNQEAEQDFQVLSFQLNDRVFTIPVADITEVNRLANITHIEKAPEYVLGVINFHKRTEPVIDLKKFLGIEHSDPDHNSMWLNVKSDDLSACLAVDKLSGFIGLAKEAMDEIPSIIVAPEARYVKSYARQDNELLPVLNVKKILDTIKAGPVQSTAYNPETVSNQ